LKELAMSKIIMIGCDLHEDSMTLKIAQGRQAPETRTVKNTAAGRAAMIADLRRRAKAAGSVPVIFAYEASGQGFGLYDQLTAADIECHVLAPTKIARSPRGRKEKTDEKDALDLLELLRGRVLAGNRLPEVWIPDAQTRDDRELVRMRLDVREKITSLKAQMQSLLKRYQLRRGPGLGKGWTKAFRGWLQRELAEPTVACRSRLGTGGQAALASLLRQLHSLEEEEERLDEQVAALASSPRYEARIRELSKLCGVGMLTALVFLSELGDLSRFANRRQIAAYLGLVPSSNESGQRDDRKGHITRQGSARVRKALCQAAWARLRHNQEEKAIYERIKSKNPKKKKIAVVASMRRLAVRMWHLGKAEVPSAAGRLVSSG
jgi:transposase